jgi:hypothetical protein
LTFTSTSSQYLTIANLPAALSFTSGISAFAQASYNAPQTGQGWQRIFDFGNGQGSDNLMMGRYGSTANAYYEGWHGGAGDQTWTSTNPIVNGTESIYEVVQLGGAAGTLTAVAHYLAGAAQAATGQAGSSQTWVPAAIARTSNYIGRSNWAADNYFSGTMSEILLYNTAFNTTQRVILENYLSAEWNQSVNLSKYTPPTTTTYGTNLVGIGYTSAADDFLTNPAGSTDGLGFSSGITGTDFLSAAGYLMAAHNGQANTVINNASVPGIASASSLTRWNRSWDVQKSGGNNAGAVTLAFNFPDYNGTTPSATNNYALLYNATDGNFATGTNILVATTSTTITGNTVSFKTAASNIANGYYTIIYSATPVVLPVVLTSFTAIAQGAAVKLNWNTSLQAGFSRFDIQRSGDGEHFSTIGTVSAPDSSTTPDQYTFTDSDPLTGRNYYRLSMVDQEGTIAYSDIHSVNFNSGNEPAVTLTVYPNPVAGRLHLALTNFMGQTGIRLLNSQGQVMRTMTVVSPSTVEIPVDGLARGVYFVEIEGTNSGRYIREIMKQ